MIKRIKFFLITLTLIMLSVIVLFGCDKENGNEAEGSRVEFFTISKGFYSMQPEKEYFIIKDEEGFNGLLALFESGDPDMINKEVDYSSELVIGVFLGEKPTGGYEIEITGVVEQADYLEVLIKINEPDPGESVTEAITSPYHMIKLEKSDKEILFNIVEY